MNDKDLDKLFKEKLENISVSPRQDLWQKIEGQLDEKKTVRLGRFGWMRYAAVAVGSLGLAALLYTFFLNEDPAVEQKQLAYQGSTKTAVNPPLPEQPSAIEKSEVNSAAASQKNSTVGLSNHTEVAVQIVKKHVEPQLNMEMSSNELITLEPAALSVYSTPELSVETTTPQYAIEIAPIQPLIDDPEIEETMLASAQSSGEGIVPNILNKISDALNPSDSKSIQFSKDEEGSLRLDIFNSLVKNRNKKRR